MNSQGISLVETMLSLVILFILTATILPMVNKLHNHLYNTRLDLHASEAAYNAALKIEQSDVHKGSFYIEGMWYNWHYNQKAICVTFNNLKGQTEKCIDSSGEM